jgi:hypothetical protein
MQGFVTRRPLGAFLLACALSACGANNSSSAGQTPGPSQTTLSQAESTMAPPEQSLTKGPGDRYYAKTGPKTHGVTFSIWANGRPITSVVTGGNTVEITPGMRGHANTIAVQWERTAKNGTGTLTVGTTKKVVLTVNVTTHSPAKGQISKTFIAPQSPLGR